MQDWERRRHKPSPCRGVGTTSPGAVLHRSGVVPLMDCWQEGFWRAHGNTRCLDLIHGDHPVCGRHSRRHWIRWSGRFGCFANSKSASAVSILILRDAHTPDIGQWPICTVHSATLVGSAYPDGMANTPLLLPLQTHRRQPASPPTADCTDGDCLSTLGADSPRCGGGTPRPQLQRVPRRNDVNLPPVCAKSRPPPVRQKDMGACKQSHQDSSRQFRITRRSRRPEECHRQMQRWHLLPRQEPPRRVLQPQGRRGSRNG